MRLSPSLFFVFKMDCGFPIRVLLIAIECHRLIVNHDLSKYRNGHPGIRGFRPIENNAV